MLSLRNAKVVVSPLPLSVTLAIVQSFAHAGPSPALPEADIQAITEDLTSRYPILAASPGLNISYFHDHPNPACGDSAELYYHPHSEQHGRKQMLRARCHKPSSEYGVQTDTTAPWICDDVMFRDYVQISSQDFEVRVEGGHSFETIEAMRKASMQALRDEGRSVPPTLIKISKYGQQDWMVMWGADGGSPSASVELHLEEGADPTVPSDWRTTVFHSSKPQTAPPPLPALPDSPIVKVGRAKPPPCPDVSARQAR